MEFRLTVFLPKAACDGVALSISRKHRPPLWKKHAPYLCTSREEF